MRALIIRFLLLSFTSFLTFAQTTGSMAQVASGAGWTTRLTIVSQDAVPVNVHLEFYGDNGSAMALPLSFPQTGTGSTTAATLDRTVAPGASLLIDTGGGAQQVTGWAKFTTTGKATGFAIFSYPALGWNAVVPLETRTSSTYLLAFDNTSPLGTGLAVANTSANAGSAALSIADDTGAPLTNGVIALPANGHQSFMLSDQYPATKGKRGVVTVTGTGVSILGLRANGPALTTLPALVMASPGNSSITHIAFNGGFTTRFTLVNTGNTSSPTTLTFFDNNGNPLNVPMSLPQTGENVTATSLSRTLALGASLIIDTVAQDSLASVTGSAVLSTSGSTSGFAIFRWTTFGQEASVPAETRNPAGFLLAFDDTGGLTTGFALANLAGQPEAVPIILRDDAGNVIATDTLSLSANGHTSFMLPSNYPAANNVRGAAELDTPVGGRISVIGLRAKSDGTLTTIPVLAVQPSSGSFDGSYTGSYSGTATTGGSTVSESGSATFSVSGSTLTVTVPGPGSGTVTSTGGITFGTVTAQGATCQFSGAIIFRGATALANGNWSCTIPGGTANGSWSASH
jgi:hypothetical protein